MSTSRDTSNSGIPNKSKGGTPAIVPFPDALSGYIADAAGSFGISGFTHTDEAPQEDTNTDQECELNFLMSAEGLHPFAIYCSTHDWRGSIS